jgi:hypothetical protein
VHRDRPQERERGRCRRLLDEPDQLNHLGRVRRRIGECLLNGNISPEQCKQVECDGFCEERVALAGQRRFHCLAEIGKKVFTVQLGCAALRLRQDIGEARPRLDRTE